MKYALYSLSLVETNSGRYTEVVRDLHPWLPFTISRRNVVAGVLINYPHKFIAEDTYSQTLVGVRTDVYPLIWMLWWFIYRVEKTVLLFKCFIIYTAAEWGLAYVCAGKLPSWQDLGKRKPSSDRL